LTNWPSRTVSAGISRRPGRFSNRRAAIYSSVEPHDVSLLCPGPAGAAHLSAEVASVTVANRSSQASQPMSTHSLRPELSVPNTIVEFMIIPSCAARSSVLWLRLLHNYGRRRSSSPTACGHHNCDWCAHGDVCIKLGTSRRCRRISVQKRW